MLKSLTFFFLLLLTVQGSRANDLPFAGENFLHSVPSNFLIIDAGMTSPLFGYSIRAIVPNYIPRWYFEASFGGITDVGLFNEGKARLRTAFLGGGGFDIRVAGGYRISEGESLKRFFWIDKVLGVKTHGNTATTTYSGYYYQAPVIKTTAVLGELWFEPSGVWSAEKDGILDGSSPPEPVKYKILETGHNAYVVVKFRRQEAFNFRFGLPGKTSETRRKFRFLDVGPVFSLDFKQFGGWMELAEISTFSASVGFGLIKRFDGPDYTGGWAVSDPVEASLLDGWFMPFRLNLGWAIHFPVRRGDQEF